MEPENLLAKEIAREVDRRRTFAIISHPDAGKTTLTEKLLLFGGAIQMAGAVKARKAARHARSDFLAIRASVVIGLPDDDLGQRIHAIVEAEDVALCEEDLHAHLEPRLVRYKWPHSFEYVAQPLFNEAGKVRRSALREERLGCRRLPGRCATSHAEGGESSPRSPSHGGR